MKRSAADQGTKKGEGDDGAKSYLYREKRRKKGAVDALVCHMGSGKHDRRLGDSDVWKAIWDRECLSTEKPGKGTNKHEKPAIEIAVFLYGNVGEAILGGIA